MTEHMEIWLDAYIDGELSTAQKRAADTHLAQCSRCQDLLEQYRRLSGLLQEAPSAVGLKPESRFISEVNLRLKRQPARLMQRNKALLFGWQVLPILLLLAFIFLQTVLILSSILGFIPNVGSLLLDRAGSLSSLLSIPQPMSGLLEFAGGPHLMSWNWLTELAALAAISLMYMCWLASWWARNRQKAVSAS